MGAPKKAPARAVSDDPEDLARVPLQAVLLADSFATRFRPITLERPKVPALPTLFSAFLLFLLPLLRVEVRVRCRVFCMCVRVMREAGDVACAI